LIVLFVLFGVLADGGLVEVPIKQFFITDSCADVAATLEGKEPFRVVSLAQDMKNWLDVLE
jgi:hypothetical protein